MESNTVVRYDPKDHTYRLGKMELKSVTRVLKDSGQIDDEWFTEEARLRGTVVAIATKLMDEGTLDFEKVGDEFTGYLRAWERFKAEQHFDVICVEAQVVNESLGVAGRCDRLGWFARPGSKHPYLLELKTGAHQEWHWLQLAGYAVCMDCKVQVGLVYLKKNGRYKYRQRQYIDHMRDVVRFKQIVVQLQERETNGPERRDDATG